MRTLQERLAELADHAPTGGAPPAELWARGKRAQRRRAATLATGMAIVVAGGAGLVLQLADDGRDGTAPAGPGRSLVEVGFALPIEYPAGTDLPDLGRSPGPLAAVWLAPRGAYTVDDGDAGLAPEAVGLVAETGTFGTLPVELSPDAYEAPDAQLALSPDGRRVAYYVAGEGGGGGPGFELVVRDLVTGDAYSPEFDFDIRSGATWVDATHLVGHVAGGTDEDGWVWDADDPGAARLTDPYSYSKDPSRLDPSVFVTPQQPPWACRSPAIADGNGRSGASVLCDVVGVVGSDILLGHLSSPGPASPDDLDRAVIALDVRDSADFPFDDPALRRVVVSPGAPYPVAFATDVIADVLEPEGAAS